MSFERTPAGFRIHTGTVDDVTWIGVQGQVDDQIVSKKYRVDEPSRATMIQRLDLHMQRYRAEPYDGEWADE